MLQRCTHTASIVLHEMHREYLPMHCHWRLNERSYGALVGKNKKECVQQHGVDQVHNHYLTFHNPGVYLAGALLPRPVWFPSKLPWRSTKSGPGSETAPHLLPPHTTRVLSRAQVKAWRRSYDVRPPAMDRQSIYHPLHDRDKYAHLPPHVIPDAESLRDTKRRAVVYWNDVSGHS